MSSKQDVGAAVKALQWRHHREANQRLMQRAGLSLVQWDVLRHLHDEPDASLHGIAVATFQTDQSMGELARRMVSRGLLERVGGPGRAVRHRLTEKGEAAYRAGDGVLEGVLDETVGTLSAAERTTLHGLLTKALGT